MKMKVFSILLILVCIGFVLMLAGSAAAQTNVRFEAETQRLTPPPTFEVNGSARLTVTVRVNGLVVPNRPITFSLPGGVGRATLANPTPMTNRQGRAWVDVKFLRAGNLDVRARVTLANNNVASYTHTFPVLGRVLTRIVATPTLPKLPNGNDAPFAVGDNFTYTIEIKGGAAPLRDLSTWQMDIAYNPQVLRVVGVPREGGLLKRGNVLTRFFSGTMSPGKITGISQARIGRVVTAGTPPVTTNVLTPAPSGVSQDGELLTIEFKVLEFAEESLGLHNLSLSNSNERRISYHTVVNPVVVTHRHSREDVNRDGRLNILDLVAVAGALGGNLGTVPNNPRADVNDDGFVNVLDLAAIHRHRNWGKAAPLVNVRNANNQIGSAPLSASVGQSADLTPATIQGWIDLAQVEDDGSAIFDLGIANLERLLQATVPEETKLLLNYPNPFNPETWIPYQLAKATDVTVSIYSVNGALVRTLALGHQAAGVYQSKSQAAYWDGRNELGERIASGVYFYTLTAGDFSATGKMLVRK